MSSQWSGNGRADGARESFRFAAIVAVCYSACSEFDGPRGCIDEDVLDAALGMLPKFKRESVDEKAAAAIMKAANKCCQAMLGMIGPWGGKWSTKPEEMGRKMAKTLAALARSGGPEAALQIAKRLVLARGDFDLPLAQWGNQQAFADVYSEAFEQGARLDDLWGLASRPDASPADQARAIIAGMAEGPIKSLFASVAERRDIALEIEGLAGKGSDAWLAKGWGPAEAGRLANIVERLERLRPGGGILAALEWLETHPEIAPEFAVANGLAAEPASRKRRSL
jgi:hypothetical protein